MDTCKTQVASGVKQFVRYRSFRILRSRDSPDITACSYGNSLLGLKKDAVSLERGSYHQEKDWDGDALKEDARSRPFRIEKSSTELSEPMTEAGNAYQEDDTTKWNKITENCLTGRLKDHRSPKNLNFSVNELKEDKFYAKIGL